MSDILFYYTAFFDFCIAKKSAGRYFPPKSCRPALSIARKLAAQPGIALQVVEPYVDALPAGLDGAELVSAQQASAEADICVLLVDHDQFRATRPVTQRLIDTRGAWKS